jgi:hypothetical protein
MRESNQPEHREIPMALSAILHDALAVRALRDARALEGDSREKAIVALDGRVEVLLDTEAGCDANRRLLKHVRKERSALFTFLRQSGVEATNWRAENAIRPAVVNRKVCGGKRGLVQRRDPADPDNPVPHRLPAGRRCRRDHDRPAPLTRTNNRPTRNAPHRQPRPLKNDRVYSADLGAKRIPRMVPLVRPTTTSESVSDRNVRRYGMCSFALRVEDFYLTNLYLDVEQAAGGRSSPARL